MRNQAIALIIVCVSCVCGVSLWGQTLTVLEDFESLTPGTIDMQHEITEWGYPVELWNAQANTGGRYDTGWSTVETGLGMGGSQCLQLINRDRDDELDTVYTCMYLGYENRITNQGTIYVQYKASQANDCIMAFNDNYPGYESDYIGDSLGEEDEYQGTANYTVQSALIRLAADQNFRARADNEYLETDMGLLSNTWYELWVQFDVPNKATRYYICEAGGTPAVAPNPNGGQWWGWRDDTNASVDNIKWLFSGQNDFAYEVTMHFDNIAVAQEYTTDSLWCSLQADINGDGVVNIYDFLLLRAKYGQPAPAGTPEDINGDGTINIYDFLILRSEYGMSCGVVN